METRWDYTGKRADFSINVHPHPAKIGKAYADFVKKVGTAILFPSKDFFAFCPAFAGILDFLIFSIYSTASGNSYRKINTYEKL
jgi:hypothetical protein